MLYAIRNGGFSGAIMPENIVVGQDAEEVAEFLAKYAGSEPKHADAGLRAAELRRGGRARRAVLDLRRSATTPTPCEPRSRAAAPDAGARATSCSPLDEQRRAATAAARVAARRAERRPPRRSAPPSARRGRRRRRSRAMREVAAQVKELTEERAPARGAAAGERSRAAQPARPRRAADEDTSIREVGEAGAAKAATTSSSPGERIDMERGARLSGSRFAYLRGDLVLLELALVRWALEKLRGHGFEPVIPPVLVREEALYGTGFLPDTEQQIYRLPEDELYLVGTSEVALASLHAGEILDAASCRCATPASRRASAARRAPPARTRAGSSACTSSTRSRCSASSSRTTSVRRARAAAGDRGGDPHRARAPLPRGEHRGRRPRRVGGARSTTARRGCRARGATAS